MADLKISQLNAITVLTPATDVLPVVDSGGVTKKITTNQILGSGGTATLASATITGAATVGTTLGVTGVSTFAAGTAALPALTTTGDTNTGIYYPAADTFAVTTGGTERYRVDSSGNVGIGVTPSTPWATNRRALQIGGQPSGAIALTGTSGSGELFFNSFFNTSSQNICVVTGGTGKYDFNVSTVGCHTWSVGTGTAGTAFTFTPAMVLDASGNLLLGTVTSPTGTKIGSISKLGSVCVEGSNAISVSTTPVALARIIGTGGLFFVSGFNTSGGAQGWWLVASIGGTAPTVIASGNNTGLTVAFTNVSGVINMNTVSGTLSVTSFAITNSL